MCLASHLILLHLDYNDVGCKVFVMCSHVPRPVFFAFPPPLLLILDICRTLRTMFSLSLGGVLFSCLLCCLCGVQLRY